MKRNMLSVLLVVVVTATVGLTGAGPATADVECRYSYLQPVNPVVQLLPPNRLFYVTGLDSDVAYNAPYELQQPLWSVVAVRSLIGNYDLGIHDCDFGHPHGASILPDSLVDFVALDGNQPIRARTFASVTNAGGTAGTFAIEYSTGGPALVPGVSQSLLMSGTPALVRDVYVPGGTSATIVLRPISGDADLAVMASGSTSDTWIRSRAQAILHSTQPGLSQERVTISVPAGSPGRTFGLVVINNARFSEATLHRF